MKKQAKFYRSRKRSIFRSRFFWSFILILMILSGVFYLVSFSSFFQIKEIEISRDLQLEIKDFQRAKQKVSFEDIQGLVKKNIEQKVLFFPSKSIFLVNLNKIKEEILKEFPQIARVDLKKDFPDKISIKIEKKKPIAIFCQPQNVEKCFLIDEEGIIIEFVSINPVRNFNNKLSDAAFEDKISNGVKDIPELTKIIGNIDSPDLGTKAIERNYLESILEIQKKITENQKLEIKEFIPAKEKLTVQISDGWQIFFDPSGDISEQILNLTTLLKEKIPLENRRNLEYIDLRFGNKIYFK